MSRFFCVALALFAVACGRLDVVTPSTPTPVVDPGDAEIIGVTISPDDPVLRVGETMNFTARAVYSDQTTSDVTSEVLWAIENARIANLDALGYLIAEVAGDTMVVVELPGAGMSDTVKLVVMEDDVNVSMTGLTMTPSEVELYVGRDVQLQATATWSDGSSGNVAASCIWATSDAGVATVDGTGTLQAVKEGSVGISADCDGMRAVGTANVVDEDVEIGLPDLQLTAFSAEAGDEEVTFTATVKNSGDALAGGFYIDFHLDGSSAPDGSEVGDDWIWVDGVAQGASEDVSVTLSGVDPGSYQSWAIVDPEGYIDEANEGNNTRGPSNVTVEAQLQGPNLQIVSFEALSDGSYTWFSYTIKNNGDVAAVDFYVDLFFDEYDEPAACDYGDEFDFVAELAPGATLDIDHEVEDGPLYYWDSWVYIDSCGDVEESDEQDNVDTLVVYPD